MAETLPERYPQAQSLSVCFSSSSLPYCSSIRRCAARIPSPLGRHWPVVTRLSSVPQRVRKTRLCVKYVGDPAKRGQRDVVIESYVEVIGDQFPHLRKLPCPDPERWLGTFEGGNPVLGPIRKV